MSKAISNPTFDLDLAQWRRDIKTFVDSTLHELTEIADQLSLELAEPGVSLATRQSRTAEVTHPTYSNRSDDRLAKLKMKLSEKFKD